MKLIRRAAAITCLLAAPAAAHRLDEYLQATIVSIEKDQVQMSMRLIPGTAVASFVISGIDTNGDGVLSAKEQREYAERVLHDVSLTIDGGAALTPQLRSVTFPEVPAMKEGLGEIQLEFTASLPRSQGQERKLVFENHHQPPISVYLVNCLVPRDHDLRVVAQKRNEGQSFYQLEYMDASAVPTGSGARTWLGVAVLGVLARLVFLLTSGRRRWFQDSEPAATAQTDFRTTDVR